MEQENKSAILVLPTSYVLGNGEFEDHVFGRMPDNQVVKVSMPPTEAMERVRAQHAVDHVPTIERFADIRSNNPLACRSNPDNSIESPDGQLLFQQAFLLGEDDGIPHFRAGWGSVISRDSENLPPEFGLGYMEIDYRESRLSRTEREEFKQLNQSFKALNRKLYAAGEESNSGKKIKTDLAQVAHRMDQMTDPVFRAVMLHPEETVSMPLHSISAIEREIEHAVERFSHQGRLGGFMLRVTDEAGRIEPGLSGDGYAWRKGAKTQEAKEVSRGYLYASGRGGVLKQYFGQGYTVDIIPTQRISAGPGGNKTYSQPAQINTLRKMYLDKRTGASLAYPMAVRLATTKNRDSHLLARSYPIGPAMGHPLQVDSTGAFTYQLRLKSADLSLANQWKEMRSNREFSSDTSLLVAGETYYIRDASGMEFKARCEEVSGQNRLMMNGMALPEGFEFSPETGRFPNEPEASQELDHKGPSAGP